MALIIERYRPEHQPAVEEFNRRLQAGGAEADLVFYRWSVPRWLPPGKNRRVYNEFFVARDDEIVRGGYALKYQDFSFADGSVRRIGYYHHPLSEGIVDKSYALVGTLLLRDAMIRSPLLYCLGMGGYDRPLPKMLVRLGWSHFSVPFYFRILRPARFLQEMQALRSSPIRRFVMDLGAYSGMGWATLKVISSFRRLRSGMKPMYQGRPVEEFSDWVDALWQKHKDAYSMTAVRDCSTLSLLYPATEQHFTLLRVLRNSTDIGWAVTSHKRPDPKYGSMKVGSIVDCWAAPENAAAVILAASKALEEQEVDLIVSNQSHNAWCDALQGAGFFKGPSNFIFAASKQLAELLKPFEYVKSRLHFTRADGDGLPRNF